MFPAAFCPFHLHSSDALIPTCVCDGKANVRSSLQQIAHGVIRPLTDSFLTHVEMCSCFITAGTGPHSDDENAWSEQMEKCPSLKGLRVLMLQGHAVFPQEMAAFVELFPVFLQGLNVLQDSE